MKIFVTLIVLALFLVGCSNEVEVPERNETGSTNGTFEIIDDLPNETGRVFPSEVIDPITTYSVAPSP